MANVTVQEASAGTAVGTDIFQLAGNTFFVTAPVGRVLRRIGVTGSTAAGNASIDLYIGTEKIGTYFNTTSGAVVPVDAKDMMPVITHRGVLAGEAIRLIISKASTTNVLSVTLELQEIA
jgi:hypothetical protein